MSIKSSDVSSIGSYEKRPPLHFPENSQVCPTETIGIMHPTRSWPASRSLAGWLGFMNLCCDLFLRYSNRTEKQFNLMILLYELSKCFTGGSLCAIHSNVSTFMKPHYATFLPFFSLKKLYKLRKAKMVGIRKWQQTIKHYFFCKKLVKHILS